MSHTRLRLLLHLPLDEQVKLELGCKLSSHSPVHGAFISIFSFGCKPRSQCPCCVLFLLPLNLRAGSRHPRHSRDVHQHLLFVSRITVSHTRDRLLILCCIFFCIVRVCVLHIHNNRMQCRKQTSFPCMHKHGISRRGCTPGARGLAWVHARCTPTCLGARQVHADLARVGARQVHVE